MKKRNVLIPIVVVSAVIILVGILFSIWFGFRSDMKDKSIEDDNINQESEEVVTPCSTGYLTVFDYQGVTHFQYEGEIVIENDGSNGEPINIQIYIPPTDPAYDIED